MVTLLSKVWYDLWSNKARTLQVVLVIALGSIAIGLVVGGSNLVNGTIADQWRHAQPPNIKLGVTPPLTDEQLQALKRIDGVAQVDGQMTASIEYRLSGQGEWKTARLEARQDYRNQKMELIQLVHGEWPTRNTLGVIKTADRLYGVGEGATVEVRINKNQVRTLPLTGTLKPVGPFPVVFLGTPLFYADRDTFTRLTGRDTFDTVLTRDVTFNRQQAEATDLKIQKVFDQQKIDSVGLLFPFQNRIVSPDIPPAAELLNAIFLILGIIGTIIIVLGIFLVYNSISAIITQQVNQIGVMKAIGARPWQILYGYALLVLAYGLLSALVSIPLGALGARWLQSTFINLLNMEDPGFSFNFAAVWVQAAVCVGAPLLAAFLPLLAGLRITVREAISTYGLNGSSGLLERLITRMQSVPYSLLLMVGNTFRHKRRVFFIELTLVLSGVIFMMVLGVNESTRYTFDNRLRSIHNYQVSLRFVSAQRIQRLESTALQDPQSLAVESWLVSPAKARPAGQAKSQVTDARVNLFGLPAATQMYQAKLLAGTWLPAGDAQGQKVAVIASRLAEARGWRIGDAITIRDTNGRESTLQVIGIVDDPLANTGVFVPLVQLQLDLGEAGRANTVWVQTRTSEAANLEAAASRLSDAYTLSGVDVSPTSTFLNSTITKIVKNNTGGFSLILQLLAIMAVIIAAVGGVGLSGVLSLNILERRREIGVMRSIGASDRQVVLLFIGEGVLLGILSWLIALPLGVPAAYWMATRGLTLALNQQLTYHFSMTGPLAWLGVVVALATIASALPARGAARLSVRESLVYQ